MITMRDFIEQIKEAETNTMNEQEDTATEQLTTAIQALIPKSLDDIIRLNRDKVTPGQPKDIIDEWNLIALCQPAFNSVQVFLLGDSRESGEQRITSAVTGIDLDKQLLITKSGSLYQLGSPKNGAPDMHQLICICTAFHGWGFANKLGVPHFFY